MKVQFTPQSRRDLKRIKHYISKKSYPSRARDFIGRIIDYCERLETFPMRGHARDDLMPGLRVIGFEHSVTILFTVTPDRVIIEGVYYGGKDYMRDFGPDADTPT